MRFKLSRGIWAAAAVLLLCGLVATPIVWWAVSRYKAMYHFDVVEEGKLYRSGMLSLRGYELIHSRTGFKTIVNVRSQAEIDADKKGWRTVEAAFAKEKGARLLDIPLEPEEPPSKEQAAQFLALFDDPKNLPVLVHCEYGVVRTGMMVALYRVKRMGMDAKTVFDTMEMYGHTLDDKAPAVKMFMLGLKPDSVRR